MLFNEPKLLKCPAASARAGTGLGFSALQRAEIAEMHMLYSISTVLLRFSALQRAENSSNQRALAPTRGELAFQCSSASRKFLKGFSSDRVDGRVYVSVLFSEPKIPQMPSSPQLRWIVDVSVLFSEPKIPQSCCRTPVRRLG